jgi:hypothetical protein
LSRSCRQQGRQQAATAAHLHEAITGDDADDELIDHTTRLPGFMASCAGMGMTMDGYPPARAVIAAHARHLGRQHTTFARWAEAALLPGRLAGTLDKDQIDRNVSFTAAERQHMTDAYSRS